MLSNTSQIDSRNTYFVLNKPNLLECIDCNGTIFGKYVLGKEIKHIARDNPKILFRTLNTEDKDKLEAIIKEIDKNAHKALIDSMQIDIATKQLLRQHLSAMGMTIEDYWDVLLEKEDGE